MGRGHGRHGAYEHGGCANDQRTRPARSAQLRCRRNRRTTWMQGWLWLSHHPDSQVVNVCRPRMSRVLPRPRLASHLSGHQGRLAGQLRSLDEPLLRQGDLCGMWQPRHGELVVITLRGSSGWSAQRRLGCVGRKQAAPRRAYNQTAAGCSFRCAMRTPGGAAQMSQAGAPCKRGWPCPGWCATP